MTMATDNRLDFRLDILSNNLRAVKLSKNLFWFRFISILMHSIRQFTCFRRRHLLLPSMLSLCPGSTPNACLLFAFNGVDVIVTTEITLNPEVALAPAFVLLSVALFSLLFVTNVFLHSFSCVSLVYFFFFSSSSLDRSFLSGSFLLFVHMNICPLNSIVRFTAHTFPESSRVRIDLIACSLIVFLIIKCLVPKWTYIECESIRLPTMTLFEPVVCLTY